MVKLDHRAAAWEFNQETRLILCWRNDVLLVYLCLEIFSKRFSVFIGFNYISCTWGYFQGQCMLFNWHCRLQGVSGVRRKFSCGEISFSGTWWSFVVGVRCVCDVTIWRDLHISKQPFGGLLT